MAGADAFELSWTHGHEVMSYQLNCDGLAWILQDPSSSVPSERLVVLPVRFSEKFFPVFYLGNPLSDEQSRAITPGDVLTLVTHSHERMMGVVTPARTLQVEEGALESVGSPAFSRRSLMGVASDVISEHEEHFVKLWDWGNLVELLDEQETEGLHVACHYGRNLGTTV